MHPYISNTKEQRVGMLKTIGVDKIEDLYSDIPESILVEGQLKLSNGLSEIELTKKIKSIIEKNTDTDEKVCFLGAGAYDHYIPSIIKHLVSRQEFYTAYTPYQAEISQGTLQAIYEYQTMICRMTKMEASNASMYDGSTACAEAAILACNATKRNKIIVSRSVSPETRKVLKTYCKYREINIVECDINNFETNNYNMNKFIDDETAAVILQNPNFFGTVEDADEIISTIHKHKGLCIAICDPIALSVIKSPGEMDVDIAVGEGQSLGNPLSFGGPYFGFFACSKKYMRKIPGRVVGMTVDNKGNRGYVLTMQAREQHIRREKASSNICSNQALNALSATIYMTTLGKEGIVEVANQCISKTQYMKNQIEKESGIISTKQSNVFKEFVVKCNGEIKDINEKLFDYGYIGGYDLGIEYPELKNHWLIAVTEKRSKEEIDSFVKKVGEIL